MWVDDPIGWPVCCASNADTIKGDDALCLPGRKHAHWRPYLPLHADAFQMCAPTVRWDKEEVTNRTVARVLPVQVLKPLIFLNALPRETDVHLLGILDPYPSGAISS